MDDLQLMALASQGMVPRRISYPNPWIGHIAFAYVCMHLVNPRRVVELGTHTGNSFFAFCQGFEDAGATGEVVAIDHWRGDEHAGFYDDGVYTDVLHHCEAHYPSIGRLMRMTFDEALPQFEDGTIDVLHIDGRHKYEDVSHDFNSWLPKVRQGGLVLFHDTNVRSEDFGVWRFWHELEKRYEYCLNFHHSNGLGVIQIPAPEQNMFAWLRKGNVQNQRVKQIFSVAGTRMSAIYEERMRSDQLAEAVSILQRKQQHISGQLAKALSTLQKERHITENSNSIRDIISRFKHSVSRDEFRFLLSHPDLLVDWLTLTASGEFDRRHYLIHNSDVQGYNDGPLLHFLRHGRFEARSASSKRKSEPEQTPKAAWYDAGLSSLFLKDHKEEASREAGLTSLFLEDHKEEAQDLPDACGGNSERAIDLSIKPRTQQAPLRVAVVVHAFYTDLFEHIAALLSRFPVEFQLFITTTSEDNKATTEGICRALGFKGFRVDVYENKGRDILPKLKLCNQIMEGFDVALFLHTKRSPHLTETYSDHGWLEHILSSLCGDADVVARILQCFAEIPHLGMIGASTPSFLRPALNWGNNFEIAHAVADEAGLGELPGDIDFPAGSMFWARPTALRSLIKPAIFEMFPDEAGQLDGTVAHAIERLFFVACEHEGFDWVKVVPPGTDATASKVETCEELMLFMEFRKRGE